MSYTNIESLVDDIKDQIQEILDSGEFSKSELENFVEELIKFLKKF
jgi:polyhydroxyalkanoate synthesis regulator phasin